MPRPHARFLGCLAVWLSLSLAPPGTLHDLLHYWWSRARSWTGRAISDDLHWAVPSERATGNEADVRCWTPGRHDPVCRTALPCRRVATQACLGSLYLVYTCSRQLEEALPASKFRDSGLGTNLYHADVFVQYLSGCPDETRPWHYQTSEILQGDIVITAVYNNNQAPHCPLTTTVGTVPAPDPIAKGASRPGPTQL